MHVKLYIIYFSPLAVTIAVNQVMNVNTMTSIAHTIKINLIFLFIWCLFDTDNYH